MDAAKETNVLEVLEHIHRTISDTERRELLQRLGREKAAVDAAKEKERRELMERLRCEKAAMPRPGPLCKKVTALPRPGPLSKKVTARPRPCEKAIKEEEEQCMVR